MSEPATPTPSGLPYAWTAHPARRRPQDVMLLVAAVLLTAGAIMAVVESPFLTVLGVVILVVATAAFWAPTRYVLDAHGATERRLGRTKSRAWTDLRRVQAGPGAMLLSPFARPHWLERYRGIIVYLDGADRTRAIELARAAITPSAPAEAAS